MAALQAIAIAPKLVSARIDLGNFYRFVKRDYKKAAIQLEEAINLSPNDAIAHGGLAAIYADQGELQRAEKEFREALQLTPAAKLIQFEPVRSTSLILREI